MTESQRENSTREDNVKNVRTTYEWNQQATINLDEATMFYNITSSI